MTVIEFSPYCCYWCDEHTVDKHKRFKNIETFTISDDNFNVIANTLADHHNYHYVLEILQCLEFESCDFQFKVSNVETNMETNDRIDEIFMYLLHGHQ